ncbi:MAG: helix-turn-helix domain-containing protein [Alphaproteobacteria bacterium]|nr:helix-turn-helix domain-containing protein [Alphaproteobacteria bacterium]
MIGFRHHLSSTIHHLRAATNIFAGPNLPDAENHFLKAQIVAELYRRTGSLQKRSAGVWMGISQPEVSRLFKGHFREYTERLLRFLTAFDMDVEIGTRPRGNPTPKTRGCVFFSPRKRGTRAAKVLPV